MSGDVAGMLVVGACTVAGVGAGSLVARFTQRRSPMDGARPDAPSATREGAVIDAVTEFVLVFDEITALAERGRAAPADYRENAKVAAHIDELRPRLDTAHARMQVLCHPQTLPVARQAADLAHSALMLITGRSGPAEGLEPLAARMSGHRPGLLDAVREDAGRKAARHDAGPTGLAQWARAGDREMRMGASIASHAGRRRPAAARVPAAPGAVGDGQSAAVGPPRARGISNAPSVLAPSGPGRW